MTEKIYVASSFEDRNRTRQLHSELISAGHEITADWTTHLEIAKLDDEAEKRRLRRLYAIEDIQGVISSTVFALLLGERESVGARIELGVAIGAGVHRICLIGEPKESQVFYSYPSLEVFADTDSFVKSLH